MALPALSPIAQQLKDYGIPRARTASRPLVAPAGRFVDQVTGGRDPGASAGNPSAQAGAERAGGISDRAVPGHVTGATGTLRSATAGTGAALVERAPGRDNRA